MPLLAKSAAVAAIAATSPAAVGGMLAQIASAPDAMGGWTAVITAVPSIGIAVGLFGVVRFYEGRRKEENEARDRTMMDMATKLESAFQKSNDRAEKQMGDLVAEFKVASSKNREQVDKAFESMYGLAKESITRNEQTQASLRSLEQSFRALEGRLDDRRGSVGPPDGGFRGQLDAGARDENDPGRRGNPRP